MTNPKVQARKEAAGEKARRVQQKLDLINYQVEGDDILILNGPFANEYVRDLWNRGPVERDWIVKHIWFRNDEKVNEILNSMCCR